MLSLIAIVVVITILVYLYVCKTYNYWNTRNVPQADLWTSLVDDLKRTLVLDTIPDLWTSIYSRSKQYRFYGIYQVNAPVLLIRDPALIKSIAVKDFEYFTDHRDLASTKSDPLWTRNLLGLHGEKWRAMRTTITPTFTGNKMRSMFSLIDESVRNYMDYYKQGPCQFTLEFKDSFLRLSNDVIASCAFGIQCDSLRNRNNDFFIMGKEATNFSGVITAVKYLISLTTPKLANLLKLQFFSANVRRFFVDLVVKTIKLRQEQNIHRPDMIHLLMEARKNLLKIDEVVEPKDDGFAVLGETQFAKNEKLRMTELTDEDITAQAMLFLTGGVESVASALSFAAYELAVNSDIQEKLRIEIENHLATNNGQLSYDIISKMKYMDMFVSETLRKWPTFIVIDRKCTKPYTIPNNSKHANENEITLNPGDSILFPIWCIHRDPEIYSDPDRFDPERFSDDNKHLITPYNYLPFGAGPRHCVAIRLALMEIKTILAHVLTNFNIIPVERTQIPLKLKTSLTLMAEKGFWFGLKRRN